MFSVRSRLGTLFGAPGALLLIAAIAQAAPCTPVQFKRGEYAGTVKGVVQPDEVVCYEVSTGVGQHAQVRAAGRNVMFGIAGVTDAQNQYSFTTEKKTYRIRVSQLMRSVSDEPFVLTISVR